MKLGMLQVWWAVWTLGVDSQVACPAYMCQPETLNMNRATCTFYQNFTYYLQVCDFGYYCNLSQDTSNSTCRWPPEPINPPVVNWVGEYCNYMTLCKHGVCYEGLCRGTALDEPCNVNADCDTGTYCKAGTCTEQIEEGETGCVYDADCVNSAGCNQGTCAPYFSIEAGGGVSNCWGNINLLCESAYCHQSLSTFVCLPSLQSQAQLPIPCTSNQDCLSASTKLGAITSNCTCGKNAQGSAYCSPFFGDSPGRDYLKVLKSWTSSDLILTCNTDRRFDHTCMQSHMTVSDLHEFWYYSDLMTFYPQIYDMDNCTWFVYFVGEQDIRYELVSGAVALGLGLLAALV